MDRPAALNPPVVIEFANAEGANRRLAGLSIVGRLVQCCVSSGLDNIAIRLPVGGRLDAAAQADVDRLSPHGLEKADDIWRETASGAFFLDSRWLLSPRALTAFIQSGAKTLRYRDAALVWRKNGLDRDAASWDQRIQPSDGEPIDLCDSLAERRLLRMTGKPLDGVVSRTINRRISQRITGLLLRFPAIRPIHATAGTALLCTLMISALLSWKPWALALGGLLYQAASIFDGVDGEMARATFRSSGLGAAADSLIDMATNLLFILGVTVQAGRLGDALAVNAGILALLIIPFGLAIIGIRTLAGGGTLNFDLLKMERPGQDGSRLKAFLINVGVLLTSRDCYALVFATLAVCGLAAPILFILAIAAAIWIVVVLWALTRPTEPDVQIA